MDRIAAAELGSPQTLTEPIGSTAHAALGHPGGARRPAAAHDRDAASRTPDVTDRASDPLVAAKLIGAGTTLSSALIGLEAHRIRVEITCARGPGFFTMVGLPEATVREARVRVKGALSLRGVDINSHGLTINLGPADLRKSGAALDVAIAIGVLEAVRELPEHAADGVLLLGELSLDGTLQPIRGILPQLESARAAGVKCAIVPAANAAEAGLVPTMDVRIARNLAEVVEHLKHQRPLPHAPTFKFQPTVTLDSGLDFSDVRGQGDVRRALEVAAAGNHNVLRL